MCFKLDSPQTSIITVSDFSPQSLVPVMPYMVVINLYSFDCESQGIYKVYVGCSLCSISRVCMEKMEEL